MQSLRQRRIEILARRNRGLAKYPNFLTRLSEILHADIQRDVLDLPATDQLFQAHCDQSKKAHADPSLAFKAVWPFDAESAWTDRCSEIGERLQEIRSVLFVGPFEDCGAVCVYANRALSSVAALLEFDGDTVSLQSTDPESGLYVDKFEENSEWMVELLAWGDFKRLAELCNQI
jgi:hypothetical protein